MTRKRLVHEKLGTRFIPWNLQRGKKRIQCIYLQPGPLGASVNFYKFTKLSKYCYRLSYRNTIINNTPPGSFNKGLRFIIKLYQ